MIVIIISDEVCSLSEQIIPVHRIHVIYMY